MEETKNDNLLEAKVVLIGEAGVGKTSIVRQFTNRGFDPNCQSSISSQFCTKIVNISDINKSIRFDLWDTSGQERYRSVAKIFYKDSRIIIFVYEIINKKSYESLKQYWYQEVKSNSIMNNAIFALVGNKIDLYNNAEVDDKEAEKWADSIGAIFQTTSALTNTGIDTLFDNLGKKIFNPKFSYKSQEEQKKELYEKEKERKEEEKLEEEYNNEIVDTKSIKLNKKNHNKKKKKSCC